MLEQSKKAGPNDPAIHIGLFTPSNLFHQNFAFIRARIDLSSHYLVIILFHLNTSTRLSSPGNPAIRTQ